MRGWIKGAARSVFVIQYTFRESHDSYSTLFESHDQYSTLFESPDQYSTLFESPDQYSTLFELVYTGRGHIGWSYLHSLQRKLERLFDTGEKEGAGLHRQSHIG